MVQKISFGKLLIVFVAGLIFTSCDRRSSCEPVTINYAIEEDYRDWFGKESTSKAIKSTTKSSSGLSETVTIHGSIHEREYFSNPNEPCEKRGGEKFNLNYKSSIYNYHIHLDLIQQSKEGAPWLFIKNQTTTRNTVIPFQLSTNETRFISYQEPSKYLYNETTAYKPVVVFYDSLEINNEQFHEVYHVTDTYLEATGKNYELTDYYINKNGLIRYDQKDGVSWVIEQE